MKSKQERLIFLERLTEILGEPIVKAPKDDKGKHVIEGDIEWGWSINMSSFSVFIDSEGKIYLQIANYPDIEKTPDVTLTEEEVLKKAKDFKFQYIKG